MQIQPIYTIASPTFGKQKKSLRDSFERHKKRHVGTLALSGNITSKARKEAFWLGAQHALLTLVAPDKALAVMEAYNNSHEQVSRAYVAAFKMVMKAAGSTHDWVSNVAVGVNYNGIPDTHGFLAWVSSAVLKKGLNIIRDLGVVDKPAIMGVKVPSNGLAAFIENLWYLYSS